MDWLLWLAGTLLFNAGLLGLYYLLKSFFNWTLTPLDVRYST